MKKRPDHATDCPGCATGWTTGDLLCPLCVAAVTTAQPTFYDRWLNARYAAEHDAAMVTMEAYRRGLIIGTAMVLSAQRTAQHAAWAARKRGGRNTAISITPLGHAILDAKGSAA